MNTKSSKDAELQSRPCLDSYYCNSRFRLDTWNRLKEKVTQLARHSKSGEDFEKLHSLVGEDLELLQPIERYWAFPGNDVFRSLLHAFEVRRWSFLDRLVTVIARLISTDHYRSRDWMVAWRNAFLPGQGDVSLDELSTVPLRDETRPYFEVLVVDSLAVETGHELRQRHLQFCRPEDDYIYSVLVVSNFEDAVIATMLNYNIQACVIRYTFPFDSQNRLTLADDYLALGGYTREEVRSLSEIDRSGALGRVLRAIRPELDLYLLSEATVEKVTMELHREFRRCFFGSEDYPEIHLTVLKGIAQRFETPFFNALKKYTEQPTGVFHAMPISRSKSISKSHWIRDYGNFYGDRIFLAETSATAAGLDSLLQPSGSIKRAQAMAARAFGAERTLFVSNGTSTANKIVLQAVTKPGDIVLLSSDCHLSHHFASVLTDIRPVYLNAYPLDQYSIVGAVPLREIKRRLLEFRQAGKLERVRALLMTNLTFDGIAYDVERFMSECLAIKPDLVFLWDEAWFAYGHFTPVTRRRSAMDVANRLRARFASGQYREEYSRWREGFTESGLEDLLDKRLLPDPDLVKVRVYSTQSTHKTLTALRQASMIHINDTEFSREVAVPMRDAYLTHTSTSPNYQILASLDIGRRQMEFEGYELVQKAFELSMILRERIENDPLLSRYFRALGPAELVPGEFRESGNECFRDGGRGWKPTEDCWMADEFAVDPTRITLDISRTGMDGETFRNLLMDRFDVQVNKTSKNTVLLIIHIGSTRGMITYLLEPLAQIAREVERKTSEATGAQRLVEERRVEELMHQLPPLPSFTRFHETFQDPAGDGAVTPEGNLRAAFYAAQNADSTEHVIPSLELARELEQGRELVSAGFVTPYPPGYPVLVPGQLLGPEVVRYLLGSDHREVHGYDPGLGLTVFSKTALG